ncbi:RING-type E3 ubiquitin transferase [Ranunculus cassubicifolius]
MNNNSSSAFAVLYLVGILTGIIFLYFLLQMVLVFCKHVHRTADTYHGDRAIGLHDEPSTTVDIGLDELMIQSYPSFIYSKAKVDNKENNTSCCSICLSDYKNTDILRKLPDCGHLFHLRCVDPWLRQHPTCPVCRSTPISTPHTKVVTLAPHMV